MLISLFTGYDLDVFYLTSEGLLVYHISYVRTQGRKSKVPPIRLYMNPCGTYDVLHDKPFIKCAGLCQSILFDLVDKTIGVSPKKRTTVYQNVEYLQWEREATHVIPIEALIPTDAGVNSPSTNGIGAKNGHDSNKSRSPRKRAPSDSSVSTPALIKQIRSYFSPSPLAKKPDSGGGFMSAVNELASSADSQSTLVSQPEPLTRPNSEEIKVRSKSPPTGLTPLKLTSAPFYSTPPLVPQCPAYVYPQSVPFYPLAAAPVAPAFTPFIAPIQTYPATMCQHENAYLYGKIKFFDESQNYGFFVLESDGTDLFVHYDDFLKAGVNKEMIRTAKREGTRFAFRCMKYFGKYDMSYKAVDIKPATDENSCYYYYEYYPENRFCLQ